MFQLYSRLIAPILPLLFVLMIVIVSCDDNGISPPEYNHIGPYDTTNVDHYKAPNGLVIYFHEEGQGDVITENHAIRVEYTGRTPDDEIFDSTTRDGTPSPTTLQLNGTVTGFMQGLAGVVVDGERRHAAREGSRRTLVIPPDLGYGESNNQLSEDTLIFDIKVLSIASAD